MAITLKSIDLKTMDLTIVGTSILVQHRFAEKARKQMRDKHAGKKTKSREARKPEAECDAALHRTKKGLIGIPAGAVKACLINTAHKDLGIEKTLVRKSLYIECEDSNGVIPIRYKKDPVMREDVVRVGNGSADLRYRPEFAPGWECDIRITYNTGNLQPEDIVNLMNQAGFGTGLLERRPEKGGDWGRFEVKTNGKKRRKLKRK